MKLHNIGTDIIKQMRLCSKAGAEIAAAAMCYVCIDTMASLWMPRGKTQQTRADFIGWVDTYVKAADWQDYQYRGIDLYAGRCGLLHSFSGESSLHLSDPTVKTICYRLGKRHWDTHGKVIVLGVHSMVEDVAKGVYRFRKDVVTDADLKERVVPRFSGRYSQMFVTVPTKDAE